MKEILAWGPIEAQFERLGIRNFKLTYDGPIEKVYELSDSAFKDLLKDMSQSYSWDATDPWVVNETGWRHSAGSNLGTPDRRVNVNRKYLKAWGYTREESLSMSPFRSLDDYLCDVVGASTVNNRIACYVSLAKANGLKLSELLRKYAS